MFFLHITGGGLELKRSTCVSFNYGRDIGSSVPNVVEVISFEEEPDAKENQ